MADSFISVLDESFIIKNNDFVAFDISDSNTGNFYTKKVSFTTLNSKISGVVITALRSDIERLQTNIDRVASDVSLKLDKRGMSYTPFPPYERMTGGFVAGAGFSALDTSDFYKVLNVHNNKIINLSTPLSDYDAAHKKYVDDKFASVPLVNTGLFVLKAGSVMSGALTLNANPVNALEAATKNYVDLSNPYGKFLPLSGGTLTGQINANSNKIINLADTLPNPSDGDAVNYKYVNSINPFGRFLPLSGGILSGIINVNDYKIINVPDITISSGGKDAVNRNYIDNKFLALSGGVMRGDISMDSYKITNIPDINISSNDNDAVNKKYVDNQISSLQFVHLSGDTLTGNLNLNGNKIINLPTPNILSLSSEAVNKKYVDDSVEPIFKMLPLSGGTINGNVTFQTGTLDISGNRITNLIYATPLTDGSDAVSKQYVDDLVYASKMAFLPLSGGTLTGLVKVQLISDSVLSAVPTNPLDSPITYVLNMSAGNVFTINVTTTIERFITVGSPIALSNTSYTITMIIKQNSEATYLINDWSIDNIPIKWANNNPPQLTSDLGKTDIFEFRKLGSVWYGFVKGQSF